jgi:hypothetical protein
MGGHVAADKPSQDFEETMFEDMDESEDIDDNDLSDFMSSETEKADMSEQTNTVKLKWKQETQDSSAWKASHLLPPGWKYQKLGKKLSFS